MSIDENVGYLDSQKKMISKYIVGIKNSIKILKSQAKNLANDTVDKRSICLSLKKDICTSGSITENKIKLKLQQEIKLSSLRRAVTSIEESLTKLKKISKNYKKAKNKLVAIPYKKASTEDWEKLSTFGKKFQQLAKLFGYSSADTEDIEINYDTLIPYLSGIELREILEKEKTDIKSDSSASDFVRLIWAYLISLNSVSNKFNGNHAGILIFDEPAQHSMGVTSLNNLLLTLSEQINLQSIVAASFEESDDHFEESVQGVAFHLIKLPRKLLQPI